MPVYNIGNSDGIFMNVFWFIWQDFTTMFGEQIQKVEGEKCHLVPLIVLPLKYNNQ
jgi:hypothetical protein